MKLQEICDKIKLKHDFSHVLGDDFIIRTMLGNLPEGIFDDSFLGGLDLSPFDEMVLWPESFPVGIDHTSPLIIEPHTIMPDQYGPFDAKLFLQNYSGWPATFADIMSK